MNNEIIKLLKSLYFDLKKQYLKSKNNMTKNELEKFHDVITIITNLIKELETNNIKDFIVGVNSIKFIFDNDNVCLFSFTNIRDNVILNKLISFLNSCKKSSTVESNEEIEFLKKSIEEKFQLIDKDRFSYKKIINTIKNIFK